jgi:hypothetical protein
LSNCTVHDVFDGQEEEDSDCFFVLVIRGGVKVVIIRGGGCIIPGKVEQPTRKNY